MKILILSPYLDAPFKKEKGTTRSGNIPEIRTHWARFIEKTIESHRQMQDDVHLLEGYMWEFTKENIPDGYDLVYIPHKTREQLPVDRALYWMQTVIPNYFTVDKDGWGASNSNYPFSFTTKDKGLFDELKTRIDSNESKFDQPTTQIDKKDYIFFPCQLPHDETIKFHSDVSVEAALLMTLQYAEDNGLEVVVKGHPVNPASMGQLRMITQNYENATWVENVSIHSCLANARAVFTVNSGVGLEALFHEKPVITYGRAEYDCVTQKASTDIDLDYAPVDLYRKFVQNFFGNHCISV